MTEDRRVTRNATIFSMATVVSRLLGLLRTALIASTFGTHLAASAFFFAYSIPNMLRRFSGEGTLGGAFIPVFTEELEKRGKSAAFRLANSIGLLVSVVAIGLMVVMGVVFQGIGLFFSSSVKTVLVVKLSQVMLPYLFFIALAGFGMAILNSLNHFLVPAISPAIHNIVLIAAILLLCPVMGAAPEEKIYGLAIGVLIGGAIQLGILYFPLQAKGYSLATGVGLREEGSRKVLQLFLPGMFSLGVTEVNTVMDKLLAFFLKESAPSELFYGNLVVELPLAVFGVSLGVAVFPSLSRLRASGKMEEFKRTFAYALRQAIAISVPASVGLIVLGVPIVKLIYQRRAFVPEATKAVAPVMMCYAFGLLAYTASKVIVPAFLSLQDAKTPMKVAVGIAAGDFAMNCFAVFVMKRVWGLALSTSLAAAVQVGVLLYVLRRKVGALGGREVARSTVRILFATSAMAVVTVAALRAVGELAPGSGGLGRSVQVVFPVSCGLICYLVFCHFLKVKEVREVVAALGKGGSG